LTKCSPQDDVICCITHTSVIISTEIKLRAGLSAIAGALVLPPLLGSDITATLVFLDTECGVIYHHFSTMLQNIHRRKQLLSGSIHEMTGL